MVFKSNKFLPIKFIQSLTYRINYRFDPLRYNPIMAAFREEEERKLFASYPPPPHLRAKAPSPHRPGPPIPAHMPMPHAALPHGDHKKEESSQSR